MSTARAIVAGLSLTFALGLAVIVQQGWPWAMLRFGVKGLSQVPFGYAVNRQTFSGIIYAHHRNGKLARLAFVWNSKLHLREYQWLSSGQVLQERSFRHGRSHGVHKVWYPSGAPRAYAQYVHGNRVGDAWSWHEDGTFAGYSLHKDGHETVIRSFSAAGKPLHNYLRQDGKLYGFKGDRLCDPVNYTRR